jgi:exopolysaccharide biosynthesis polyprenyl glycosylphosphotransferase
LKDFLPEEIARLSERLVARDGLADFHAEPCTRFVPEPWFTRLLSVERKRAERSKRQFLLMLLHAEDLLHGSDHEELQPKMIAAVLSATRDTDLSGWYEQSAVAGTILTEIRTEDVAKTITAVHSKVNAALLAGIGLSRLNRIHISFHLFPEHAHTQPPGTQSADMALYPDLSLQNTSKKVSRALKRALDISGSVMALTFLSPLLAVIAVAIKLTSEGPVLFRQERLGQYGIPFTFLKFRSMDVNTDASLHREYSTQFICGSAEQHLPEGDGPSVYKLTRDPRVTNVGRLLRRTSLDELPQFLNVLKGEMSLVGPRPPIAYECACYQPWHRRRLLEVKPGITGLWQVSGRSKLKFDDMVRLDLHYAKAWSLGLDLKILFKTPRAVLSREGAY